MANAIVQCQAPTGLSLTLSLYAFSSDDTLANSGGADTLTEKTNNKGLYQATVTEGLSGWHWAKILDGSSNLIAHYAVWMSDTTNTHRCVDLADVYAVGGTAQTSGDIIGDTNDIQSRLPSALVGGRIDANVGAISADATAADNAEAFFDGTGYAGTNNVIPTVTTVTNAVSANVTQISGDAVAADNLEAALDGTGGVTITAGLTGNVTGNLSGSVGSLATQAKADVNAEVVDALATDTYAEPGQGAPAATASIAAKINYLYKSWRNKKTQTSTTWNLFADDTTTVDQKSTVSDDGTTATKGEIATGP